MKIFFKKTYFGAILGPFYPYLSKKDFFLEKSVSVGF